MNPAERRRKRIRNNTIAGITSLLLVALYIANLGIAPRNSLLSSESRQGSGIENADKVANGLVIERYDPEGRLSHRLATEKAEILPLQQAGHGLQVNPDFDDGEPEESFLLPSDRQRSGSTEELAVHRPFLSIFHASGGSARVSAAQGRFSPGHQQLSLQDTVKLVDSEHQTILLTDTLTIDTEQKQVFSQSPVKLIHPQSTTTAVGLQGSVVQQHWQLLADVESTIYAE